MLVTCPVPHDWACALPPLPMYVGLIERWGPLSTGLVDSIQEDHCLLGLAAMGLFTVMAVQLVAKNRLPFLGTSFRSHLRTSPTSPL